MLDLNGSFVTYDQMIVRLFRHAILCYKPNICQDRL
eukprot:COSAG06_NODE_41550_length_390_cov_0.780069_1_plen_35_part_01